MTAAVVAVVAHPDDESLIAGGTLALAARAGASTGVVSLTRGEQGPVSDQALVAQATLGDVRERELAAAAAELDLDWSACLRLPDGELAWSDHAAAADELATVLAPHAPSALLSFAADGLYGHPDHVAAAEIAMLASERLAAPADLYRAAWPPDLATALVAAARERGLATDLWGLEPEAFGWGDVTPTLIVDVRSVLDAKLAALRAHRSQIGAGHVLAALPDDLAERFLGAEPWAGPAGGGALEALLEKR